MQDSNNTEAFPDEQLLVRFSYMYVIVGTFTLLISNQHSSKLMKPSEELSNIEAHLEGSP
ncbi:hypothetical protein YN1_6830 [Nanoarchaeota archaeon]